ILTGILASISILATTASLVKRDEWWIRVFDFPRLQISFITLGAMALQLAQYDLMDLWQWIIMAILLASLLYQLTKIYPYTFLSKKQVAAYAGPEDDDSSVSILISNVLKTNKQYDRLISLVEQVRP